MGRVDMDKDVFLADLNSAIYGLLPLGGVITDYEGAIRNVGNTVLLRTIGGGVREIKIGHTFIQLISRQYEDLYESAKRIANNILKLSPPPWSFFCCSVLDVFPTDLKPDMMCAEVVLKVIRKNNNKEQEVMNKTMARVMELAERLGAAKIDTRTVAVVMEEGELRDIGMDLRKDADGSYEIMGMKIMMVPDAPKWVPLCRGDLPEVCWVRKCGKTEEFLIVAKDVDDVSLDSELLTYQELFDGWEYYGMNPKDFGKCWQPCRKEAK
jgi:hypothetical protein